MEFSFTVLIQCLSWVVGALEASTRAVHRILCESYPDKLEEFERECGFAEGWTRDLLMKQVAVTLEDVIGEFPPDSDKST